MFDHTKIVCHMQHVPKPISGHGTVADKMSNKIYTCKVVVVVSVHVGWPLVLYWLEYNWPWWVLIYKFDHAHTTEIAGNLIV